MIDLDDEQLVKIVTEVVETLLNNQNKEDTDQIPIGVSNRHVHVSQEDLEVLFGKGANLHVLKDLSQPGQYACDETVTLVGPKGVFEKVRILGPSRNQTQVEVALSDCFKLGIKAPIKESGDLAGSAGITLVGPVGSVTLDEGCIVAKNHIHMHTLDGMKFGVKDGDKVNVKTTGPRSLIFGDVTVRVSDKYQLEMHVDLDEANAASLKNGDTVQVIKSMD